MLRSVGYDCGMHPTPSVPCCGEGVDFISCQYSVVQLGIGIRVRVFGVDIDGFPNENFKLINSGLVSTKARSIEFLCVNLVGGME